MKRKGDADFVYMKIEQQLRLKKIMLPTEFSVLTKFLTLAEIDYIKNKLISNGYSLNEELIEVTVKSRSEEEIDDSKLLDFLIRPDYVNTGPETIQVGNQFYMGIVASGFPANVGENWLGELTQEKRDVDFSLFIEPSGVSAIESYLSKQLRKVENDLYSYQQKGVSNPALSARRDQIVEQLKQIVSGQYKLFKLSLHIAAKGQSQDEVTLLASSIASTLHSQGIETKFTTKYNEQLLKSIIPAGQKHLLSREILVPGPAAAASFPFTSSFLDIDQEDGVLLGFNGNGIPVAKSIWKLPKYVGTILGSTGSGKSYAAKALLLGDSLINHSSVFILDPEDEYTKMCENIENSQVIRLSRTSKNIPNILALMGVNLSEKLTSLTRIFEVLLSGLNEVQKPLLEQSLIEVYKCKGITENNKLSWSKNPPMLSDLSKVLKDQKSRAQDMTQIAGYEDMISKLSRYTTGVFRFMNTSGSELNPRAQFNVIEFKSMPEEVRPVLMMVLLEFIKTTFLEDKKKKILVIDEAWRVLKNKQEAAYVEAFARTFRKSNGSLLLVTQSVAELQDCSEGKAYLANSSFAYIFKTQGIVLDETCRLFGLNDTER